MFVCFFVYHRSQSTCEIDYDLELPVCKLAIGKRSAARLQASLSIRQGYSMPIDGVEPKDMGRELFYLCGCVVTNVATELSPTELIHLRLTL